MTQSVGHGDATPERMPQPTIWTAPVAILFGLWLLMAFSSGGFLQSQWLLPGLGIAFLALVVGTTRAYPRLPGQLSLAMLALFALHVGWTVLSVLWASSINSVWDEAARTALYLLAMAVALVYFSDRGARAIARYILLACALVTVSLVTWRLATLGVTEGSAGADSGSGLASLFIEDRLAYPTSYPNGAAALFLVLFWPLLWMAADPREYAPVRGLSMAAGYALLALTIMTQSRGALWAGVITLGALFLISPARLRTLLFLTVPALLIVWGFSNLNSYWRLGPDTVGGGTAVQTILVGMVVSGVAGVTLATLERWVKIAGRLKLGLGFLVLLTTAGVLAFGVVLFDREVGEPTRWVGDWWRDFTAEKTTVLGTSDGEEASDDESAGSRFLTISTSGRWDLWRVAWLDFRDSPWFGVGAGNFVYTYELLKHRESSSKPRQPHSLSLRLLSETGMVGAVLLVGGLALGLGGILWPRISAGWHGLRRAPPPGRWGSDPMEYAWEMALATAIIYWLVHANVEWLWHMPGVSLVALLFLAWGVASVDARAGVLWPRLSKFLPPSTTTPAGPDTEVASGRRAAAWFSIALSVVAVVTFVALALPYISWRFQETALGRVGTDYQSALDAASLAAHLQPVDPNPVLVEAEIHRFAAADSAGEASLDHLALSLDAYLRAVDRNPSDWALHYRVSMGAMRLLEASTADTTAIDPDGEQETGAGAGIVTESPEMLKRARELRALSTDELRSLARGYLVAARERSPLNGEIDAGMEKLNTQRSAPLQLSAPDTGR